VTGSQPKGGLTRVDNLHALQLLTAGKRQSLTDVALDCDFFDQAHFNHEFRELAGMSPGDALDVPERQLLKVWPIPTSHWPQGRLGCAA